MRYKYSGDGPPRGCSSMMSVVNFNGAVGFDFLSYVGIEKGATVE